MNRYGEVWVLDFEFHAPPGENAEPLCLVAHELHSGRRLSFWWDEFPKESPFPDDALVIAYYASAEMGCFQQLGWSTPSELVDLYAEFRNAKNGRGVPAGYSLLGALAAYGIPGEASATKDEMRGLAIRGGPFTEDEKRSLLEYCATDVEATARLARRMWPGIDLPYALLRGQYMVAVAHMERTGVPIDVERLALLRERWGSIKSDLVATVDRDFGVYEDTTFKLDRFEAWLVREDIAWPRTETGRLALAEDTFKRMAKLHPELHPLRQLRAALGTLRQFELPVGADGRNRCLLSPFSSRTGRNQPSSTQFVFALSAWLRGIVKPLEGTGLAYIDWSQQEFGIAAVLSGDAAMIGAYESGDPYMSFAIQAGEAPKGATKKTHGEIRERFKVAALGVNYGQSEFGLASTLGILRIEARELLELHHRTFPRFWEWSQAWVDHALLHGWIETTFGWRLRTPADPNARSLANFAAQGNGAEMLRLACCYATRAGVRVCAPVHDALLIEAPLDELAGAVEETRAAMARASRDVLAGFELDTDVELVVPPHRYSDPRGAVMWGTVEALLGLTEPSARERTQREVGQASRVTTTPAEWRSDAPA